MTTPTSEAPRQLRGRELERAFYAEMLQELRGLALTMTEFAERLAGRAVNHVLKVRTVIFDATGQVFEAFGVAAGSIEVTNLSTVAGHNVVVHAAGPMGAAPGAGVGVYFVPPASTRVIALGSRQLTLYGTAGDTVSYQVFTSAVQPAAV